MSLEQDKKTILTIDDVSINLYVIKSLLSKYFDVKVAKSGELALHILSREKIDLILLDIEMPGMSGFDFIDVMRKNPNLKDIPIICITSHTSEKNITKAVRAGVKDFVGKPMEKNVLEEKVFAALNLPMPK